MANEEGYSEANICVTDPVVINMLRPEDDPKKNAPRKQQIKTVIGRIQAAVAKTSCSVRFTRITKNDERRRETVVTVVRAKNAAVDRWGDDTPEVEDRWGDADSPTTTDQQVATHGMNPTMEGSQQIKW